MSADQEQRPVPMSIGSAGVLARGAAVVWLRTMRWGIDTSLRVSGRIARAAVDPESAIELLDDLRGYAREALGIADLDERLAQMVTPAGAAKGHDENGRVPERALRIQGAELLRESADVDGADGAHPAYARILDELAPDEARILRLLLTEGPQPSVDVRSTSLIGVASDMVAPRMTMIGVQAGCRHSDRVPAYLNNLERLGLICFSEEPIEEPAEYQVLEAQPEVLAAIKRATRARSLHHSIRLTDFGRDFCEVCLPLDTADIDALSGERV